MRIGARGSLESSGSKRFTRRVYKDGLMAPSWKVCLLSRVGALAVSILEIVSCHTVPIVGRGSGEQV